MELGALFDLAAHGPDTFVGAGPRYPWGGLYGGQIVAQALRAAATTVDGSLAPHSLRAYFIRRGDNTEPVRYEVDRIRNGSSFSTRRVVARQAVGAILNLEASFQVAEEAADVATIAMPGRIPGPDRLETSTWSDSFEQCVVPSRLVDGEGRDGSGRVIVWMRVKSDVGVDPLLHCCWLAFLSDDLPNESVRRALALAGVPGWPKVAPTDDNAAWEGIAYGASLDHTVWFHRPFRVDEWHLYDFTCHGYGGGRGLSIGHVFTADGVHAATVAQEVLLRRARPST